MAWFDYVEAKIAEQAGKEEIMDIESLLTEASDQRKTLGRRLMTQHTPGPWTVRGLEITDGRGEHLITYVYGAKDGKQGTPEGNAKLIAAAPALYEALKECAKEIEASLHNEAITEARERGERKTHPRVTHGLIIARQAIEDAS